MRESWIAHDMCDGPRSRATLSTISSRCDREFPLIALGVLEIYEP